MDESVAVGFDILLIARDLGATVSKYEDIPLGLGILLSICIFAYGETVYMLIRGRNI